MTAVLTVETQRKRISSHLKNICPTISRYGINLSASKTLTANYPKTLPVALKSNFAFEIQLQKALTTRKMIAKKPSTLVIDMMGNGFQSNVS